MNNTNESTLFLAVPNKGRLSEDAVQLLARAGLWTNGQPASRQLFANAWNGRVRILFVRAQDVPELVQDGYADLGITGLDLVLESGRHVADILDLKFGKCRLVAAVPQKRRIASIDDLDGDLTVATAFPNLTRRFFDARNRKVRIVPVSGATEVMPHIGVADVITDLVATGSTLAMNDLVELECIQESTARLIANHERLADPARRSLIDELRFALESVVNARGKRYLMADVPADVLDEVRALLPGIAGPTVMDIYGQPGLKAVHVVVDENEVYAAMRSLKQLGARGLLVVPVDRMVD